MRPTISEDVDLMAGGWLDKLKDIFHIDLSRLKSLVHIQINITTNISSGNKCEIVEGNEQSARIDINLPHLSKDDESRLKEILRSDAFSDVGHFVQGKTLELIEAFQETERSPDIQKELLYFRGKIPDEDIPMFRACLFLKKKYDQGVPIHEIKARIMTSYGQRGKNLANLCSAGYLNDWLRPLYESLEKGSPTPIEAVRKFQQVYHNIVDELPWTVFVSRHSPSVQIKSEVLGKIDANLKYGIRWLNIHALGKENLCKLRSVLDELEAERADLHVEITKDEQRMTVRLKVTKLEQS